MDVPFNCKFLPSYSFVLVQVRRSVSHQSSWVDSSLWLVRTERVLDILSCVSLPFGDVLLP
jgi:hypothetical protein